MGEARNAINGIKQSVLLGIVSIWRRQIKEIKYEEAEQLEILNVQESEESNKKLSELNLREHLEELLLYERGNCITEEEKIILEKFKNELETDYKYVGDYEISAYEKGPFNNEMRVELQGEIERNEGIVHFKFKNLEENKNEKQRDKEPKIEPKIKSKECIPDR